MSQDPPVLLAMAPCWLHRGVFQFDPDKVTSVLVDPVTNNPPDVDPETGEPLDTTLGWVKERIDWSIARPLCPPCCKRLNDAAQEAGRGRPFDETDTSGGQVIE